LHSHRREPLSVGVHDGGAVVMVAVLLAGVPVADVVCKHGRKRVS